MPSTANGIMRNIVSIYATANHLYFAVLFPTKVAQPIGNFRVIGIAKNRTIPNTLKNK